MTGNEKKKKELRRSKEKREKELIMPVVFTWHPGNVYVIKNIHTKICGNFHIEHKSLLFFIT